MKKWGPILVLILFVCALLAYELNWEDKKKEEKPVAPIMGSVTVYTDISNTLSSLLAKEYEEKYHIKVNVLPLTEKQMAEEMVSKSPFAKGDLIITNRENLIVGAKGNILAPYISENVDLVNEQFKDKDNAWVGLWYDPIVFVENDAFFKEEGKKYTSWRSLRNYGDFTIVLPDFVASVQAANILYSFVEERGQMNGLAYFISIKDHISQYSKYLNTPVRLAALGEANIGIGNYSDAILYGKKNYPVKVIYPEDGTPYYLTGEALLKDAPNKKEAKAFMNWLLTKDVAKMMQDNGFYYVYANPEVPKAKDSLGRDLIIFHVKGEYTKEGKEALLKSWINTARF